MLDDRFPDFTAYDRRHSSLLDGRVRLRKILDHGGLPWREVAAAQRELDKLRVPYVVLSRQRHYHIRDIEEAIAAAEVRPGRPWQPPEPSTDGPSEDRAA